MKGLEYETANPGQDFDENETKLFDPETDVERPIVNAVAGGSTSGPSRPISGDTLSAYRREEALQQQQQQQQAQYRDAAPNTPRHQAQPSASTIRSPRRLSSPLPPIDAEDEKSTSHHDPRDRSNTNDEDIIHGGPHYSHTANILDPRVQSQIDAIGTYQAGPDVEAGQSRV